MRVRTVIKRSPSTSLHKDTHTFMLFCYAMTCSNTLPFFSFLLLCCVLCVACCVLCVVCRVLCVVCCVSCVACCVLCVCVRVVCVRVVCCVCVCVLCVCVLCVVSLRRCASLEHLIESPRIKFREQ